jgi:hypothetical protein
MVVGKVWAWMTNHHGELPSTWQHVSENCWRPLPFADRLVAISTPNLNAARTTHVSGKSPGTPRATMIRYIGPSSHVDLIVFSHNNTHSAWHGTISRAPKRRMTTK